MSETRALVHEAITQDLLGPEVLLSADVPSAPGGYRLLRLLGRGGCGEVHLARDTRLDRLVALKFLTNAAPADVERFRREARFAARLNNPSIVAVYELGEHTGRPYIAMQYVEGRNFADAALGIAAAARVVREVAEALHHAHGEGIVHRDIKPQNILVDRDGRAHLTDFGIARSLRAGAGETISVPGQIIGTPALMAPEQARGDIQAVDARSDVYALGATLFSKLAGRQPFEGDNLVDLLHAVIHGPPPLVRTHNASVPRSLEAIIVRCMQKAREDRYQTMQEVIADIDRFLSGEPVGRESAAWFRRLVGQLHGAVPAPSPEDPGADPAWAAGLEIVREIAAWDADLYRVSGSLARSFTRLETLRQRLEAILAGRPEIAWARFYRGAVHFRRGRLTEALEDMERSIDRMGDAAAA
jgi:predicted Ser/Thr protein kinase